MADDELVPNENWPKIELSDEDHDWIKALAWDLPEEPRFLPEIIGFSATTPIGEFLASWKFFQRLPASQAMPDHLRALVDQVLERIKGVDENAAIGPLIADLGIFSPEELGSVIQREADDDD